MLNKSNTIKNILWVFLGGGGLVYMNLALFSNFNYALFSLVITLFTFVIFSLIFVEKERHQVSGPSGPCILSFSNSGPQGADLVISEGALKGALRTPGARRALCSECGPASNQAGKEASQQAARQSSTITSKQAGKQARK